MGDLCFHCELQSAKDRGSRRLLATACPRPLCITMTSTAEVYLKYMAYMYINVYDYIAILK